ncbi:hypothetical protein NL676_027841 [Syzygium grande]|nr:hypothetical protein NL676_027841 [Syzygium grande]
MRSSSPAEPPPPATIRALPREQVTWGPGDVESGGAEVWLAAPGAIAARPNLEAITPPFPDVSLPSVNLTFKIFVLTSLFPRESYGEQQINQNFDRDGRIPLEEEGQAAAAASSTAKVTPTNKGKRQCETEHQHRDACDLYKIPHRRKKLQGID